MTNDPQSRLDSWKEIAEYLGRDVRTVIRWEKVKKLPVRRVPGGKRRAVFAYTEEVDSWLAEGQGSSVGWPEAHTHESHAQLRELFRWTVPVVLAVLVVGLALVPMLHSRGGKLTPRLATVVQKGNKLVAFNEQGDVSWGLDLLSPPRKLLASKVIPKTFVAAHHERVLVSLRTKPEEMHAKSDEVQLLSNTGKRIWRLVPHSRFHFGDLEAGPPWEFQDWSVVNARRGFMVAVAVAQHRQSQSMILLADSRGKVAGRYVHNGRITTLRTLRRNAATLLLAGGASHSANSAALLVLDVNHLDGSTPEPADSTYSCDDCAHGLPLRYFTFPRSEINRVAGSVPSRVREIEIGRNGIEVHTVEAVLFGDSAEAIYEFSADLELKSASFTKNYWHIHRELELAGKLSHSKDSCPDRFGPRIVRVWDNDAGWSTLQAGD